MIYREDIGRDVTYVGDNLPEQPYRLLDVCNGAAFIEGLRQQCVYGVNASSVFLKVELDMTLVPDDRTWSGTLG